MNNQDKDTNAKANSAGEKDESRTGDEIPSEAPFERWLDKKLRTVYGSVLEEAIPQDIIDLLRQRLDEK